MVTGKLFIEKRKEQESLATIQSLLTIIRDQVDKLAGEDVISGSVTANWQAAETQILVLGAADTKYKLHSLLIDMNTIAGTLTTRLYIKINGTERRVYSQTYTVAVDGPALWLVNGTIGIHDELRLTAQSNNAADNGKAIAYEYMLEEM